MGGFRDDREAMRARIEALEGELRRGGPEREQVQQKLSELAAEVSLATERVDTDRKQLADVASRIDALREQLGGKPKRPVELPELAGEPPKPTPSTSRGGIIAVAILVSACIAGIAVMAGAPSSSPPPDFGLDSVVVAPDAIPGGIHAADPVALLKRARGLAPAGADLVSVRIEYAKSDGTVDLDHSAYDGSMTFRFGTPPAEPPPPDPNTPIGAPQPAPDIMGGSTAVYRVDARGMRSDSMAMFGFSIERPIPLPRCMPADIWRAAIGAGAPEDAVASLEYAWGMVITSVPEHRAVWHFTIAGTGIDLTMSDPGCEVIEGRGAADPVLDPEPELDPEADPALQP